MATNYKLYYFRYMMILGLILDEFTTKGQVNISLEYCLSKPTVLCSFFSRSDSNMDIAEYIVIRIKDL